MPDTMQIETWRAQLRSGDSAIRNKAATEVFECYMGRLASEIRQLLGRRVAQRVGVSEIAQSAFARFFHRLGSGKEDDRAFYAVLLRIATRRTVTRLRRHLGPKRDVKRDQTFEDEEHGLQPKLRRAEKLKRTYRRKECNTDGEVKPVEPEKYDPAWLQRPEVLMQLLNGATQEEVATVAEMLQHLTRRSRHGEDLLLVAFRRIEGFSVDEIAEELDCQPWRVRTMIQLIEKRWKLWAREN